MMRERHTEGEKECLPMGKGFKHGGAFPICTSISLEIILAEKAIDLE
jgi:hypothetical protein